jgi:hypothetical protein
MHFLYSSESIYEHANSDNEIWMMTTNPTELESSRGASEGDATIPEHGHFCMP